MVDFFNYLQIAGIYTHTSSNHASRHATRHSSSNPPVGKLCRIITPEVRHVAGMNALADGLQRVSCNFQKRIGV